MTKVLVVDDHEIIRTSLKRMLDVEDDIEVVGLCNNGLCAYEFVKDHDVDIILMDAVMPIMNGVTATEKIKKYNENVKVIILTTFSDDKLIYDAFNANVDGYLLKDITSKKLVECLRNLMAGMLIIPGDIAKKIVKMMDSNIEYSFNQTEREVIDLLIEGLSNKEVAKRLNISYGTTRNYISDIYKKVGENNRKIVIEKLKDEFKRG